VELLVALTIGVLLGTGTFMLLRPRGFPVVQGVILLSHGINLHDRFPARPGLPGIPAHAQRAGGLGGGG
jgi:multicomponent K+:H+ antiporter subunit C